MRSCWSACARARRLPWAGAPAFRKDVSAASLRAQDLVQIGAACGVVPAQEEQRGHIALVGRLASQGAGQVFGRHREPHHAFKLALAQHGPRQQQHPLVQGARFQRRADEQFVSRSLAMVIEVLTVAHVDLRRRGHRRIHHQARGVSHRKVQHRTLGEGAVGQARRGLGRGGVAGGELVANLDQGQVGGVQQAFHLTGLGVGHLHGARGGQLQGFFAQVFVRGVQPPQVQ
jgi:hypothetical protein